MLFTDNLEQVSFTPQRHEDPLRQEKIQHCAIKFRHDILMSVAARGQSIVLLEFPIVHSKY